MCIFRFRNPLNPSYIQEVLPLENNFMTVADEYVCVYVSSVSDDVADRIFLFNKFNPNRNSCRVAGIKTTTRGRQGALGEGQLLV